MMSAVRKEAPDPENDAIRQVALDYIDGWYDGDHERMASSLHPGLAKRIVERNCAESASWPAGDRLDEFSAMRLIERAHHESVPRERRRSEVRVLDRFENAASVRVDAFYWIDYIHMAKFNGRWKIINVLWELRP